MKSLNYLAIAIATFTLMTVAEAQNEDDQSTDVLIQDQRQLDRTLKDIWDNSDDSIGSLKERYNATKEGLTGVLDRTTDYISNTVNQITGGCGSCTSGH